MRKHVVVEKWDLCGIPCPHVISAISFNKEKAKAYVDGYYSVDTQKNYKELIHPINGENSWLESDYKPLTPQVQKRQSGRPKNKG